MSTQSHPNTLNSLLQAGKLPPASQSQTVAGGDIGDSTKVTLEDGRAVFVKRATHAPDDFLPAEAAGLEALREAAPAELIRVPVVHYADTAGLVLEWLEPAARAGDYWERFGAGLAAIHRIPRPHFGFGRDNYCGLTSQPNPNLDDGYHFFATARLQHQARLARDHGRLSTAECRKLDRLCERLDEWIPAQPPALIHGDLWSGNAHTGPKGEPVLIDPAAHYGWAEAELAMTTLFGRFPDRFYDSYLENSDVAGDWEDRADLYNLYHLLNHLNLFGGGYLGSVKQVLARRA
jgi:fructosamine-3-kinase